MSDSVDGEHERIKAARALTCPCCMLGWRTFDAFVRHLEGMRLAIDAALTRATNGR